MGLRLSWTLYKVIPADRPGRSAGKAGSGQRGVLGQSVTRTKAENLVRTGRAVGLLPGTLLLLALCILSTVMLDWLFGMIVDKEATAYQVSKIMTDVLLLGCGVVVTIGGTISVVGETWNSVVSSPSREENDAHDGN